MFEVWKPSDQAAAGYRKPKERIRWPWKDMKVGDMVRIKDKEIAKKAVTRAHVYGRPHGITFRTQTINGVLHIWRLK
jgi:hypothetical protein